MSTTNLLYAQGQVQTDNGYQNVKVAGVKRNCGTPACSQSQYYPPPPQNPYYYPPPQQAQTHVDMVPVIHHTGAYPNNMYGYNHQHLPIIIDATEPETTAAPITTAPPQKGLIITGPNGNPYILTPGENNDGNYAITLPLPYDTTAPPTAAPTSPPETTTPPPTSDNISIDRNTLNQILSVICIFVLILLLWTVMGASKY
jgi:hypothetical protein